MDFVTSDPEHPYYAQSAGFEEPAERRELREWRERALDAEEKYTRLRDPIETDLEAANAELAEVRAQLHRALSLNGRLGEALACVMHDLHPVYGTTSGPYGGVGGQAATQWCHVKDPYTTEHDDTLHSVYVLLREVGGG